MDIETNRKELALTLSRLRLGTAHEVYVADYVRDCADRNPTDAIVAVVIQDNGEVYDVTFNWETAESMATDGYRVLALTGDGLYKRNELQRVCDSRRAEYRDCYGL